MPQNASLLARAAAKVIPINGEPPAHTENRIRFSRITQERISRAINLELELEALEIEKNTEALRRQNQIAEVRRELRAAHRAIMGDLQQGAVVERGRHIAYIRKRTRWIRGLVRRRIVSAELVLH